MNASFHMLLFFIISLFIKGYNVRTPEDNTNIRITFNQKVKGEDLVLKTKKYVNPLNETYSVSVLKYYISNIKLIGKKDIEEFNSYHLIDASNPTSESFTFPSQPGMYLGITFLIGVDSMHNVSGAQAGELDPLKGMFWTWNSGYIMAKLEGVSDVSKNNQRYEYHIGGFEGEYNVLHKVTLIFKEPFVLLNKTTNNIQIDADINTWWGAGNISIGKTSVIAVPGKYSKRISDNYARMFTLNETVKSP